MEERIDRTDWRDRLGMDWMAGLDGWIGWLDWMAGLDGWIEWLD